MPTLPSPSPKFRMAGFPQYGFKAGMSDRAFPFGACPSRRSVGLRPSCTPLPVPSYPRSKSRDAVRLCTTVQATFVALPQGPSLRSELCCLGPSSLMRPHAPHSPAHLDFTDSAYTRCLRCASPPRRPASGSVLSLCVPSRHAVLCDRGEFIGCSCSVPSPTTLAFALSPPARHSRVYRHPLRTGESISRLPRFAVATACRVACPLAVLTGRRPADGDFYSRAFGGSVTLPVVGYNYGGN